MNYLLGLIAALIAGFFYQKNRANNATALNDNLATKEKVDALSNKQASNDAELQVEEQKQTELQKELQNEQTNLNLSDLLNFFTKRK